MTELAGELRGKKILVTGASGFVGSKLVQTLLDYNAEVFAQVDQDANMERIASLVTNRGLHLIRCTLNDARALSAQRPGWGDIEYLVHLWLKAPAESDFCDQSIKEIYMNLLPAINLVKVLGKSVGGICFASSVSVYGYPSHIPVTESHLATPVSSYGVTKLAIENYLKAYGKTNNIPVTILRYATIYGPGELKHRAIPNFINRIAGGQRPVIFGDGSETRDYVYIEDVVRATTLAIAKKQNAIFNIGSGRGYTTLEILQKIMKLYPIEIEPSFVPGNGKNMNLVCDISAARETLSYYPLTSLEDGLAREIEWYKKRAQKPTPGKNKQFIVTGKSKTSGRLPFKYLFFKDVIQRIIAFLVLTVLSPLLALIGIGVMIDSRGSPIFTQERVGKDGRKFTVYKFRTMHINSDDSKYKEYLKKYVLENAPYRVRHDGKGIYKVDDVHTTRLGSWLRKTNLDELPQFFNVLKGDMSIIGPRPDVPFSVQMYKKWHRERLQAKPGITGLWQVCGRRGLSFDEMARLDIDYIERQSLRMDVKILLSTVGIILKTDGS